MEEELVGIILDVDYTLRDFAGIIKVTLRSSSGAYLLFDYNFKPYFYLAPINSSIEKENIAKFTIIGDNNRSISAREVLEEKKTIYGREISLFKIVLENPKDVPKLSDAMKEFGTCYEDDIVFWKRYLLDKDIIPLMPVRVKVHTENGEYIIDSIANDATITQDIALRHICFDIETYNPLGVPRQEKDPIIMMSYDDGKKHGVMTTKKINRDFVTTYASEKEMLQAFIKMINDEDYDIISGYNSSNFDLPYIEARAKKLGIEFSIGRWENGIKKEHHGLIEAVRIPGRVNLDIYNVAKFVAVVGAAEKLIKVNNFTLGEVYRAVTGNEKNMVEKKAIWKLWDSDSSELEELTDYSLSDSVSLEELYQFFTPIEFEVAKVSGTTLGEAAISTTGQLVEYLLMRSAQKEGQLIPNKPSESESAERLNNPIIGAYVKTPEVGIYNNIIVFDFRSLYPSIIIAHNIDPSTICENCTDYYESPDNVKFRKEPIGIMPKLLKMLIDERKAVKKAYKSDPDNKTLGARSQALKITANSFYGYLGYARSRWYSRECASSVTAYGRLYITKTIQSAESEGFKVLYADTDSLMMLLNNKTREDAMKFLKKTNDALPKDMELELEDFYTRGVFVGKGTSSGGAKKKYALLSESGRIKIKGFELVRRDWSKVARDTQKAVLEAILKDGSKEKALAIVRDVVNRLREGNMPLKELVINTQIRKGISTYDIKSPELAAAKKAMASGIMKRDEIESITIGYIITKNGNSISEKAEVEQMAKDYDPEYYIDHQVIPATLKILREFGYTATELKSGGTQKKLL